MTYEPMILPFDLSVGANVYQYQLRGTYGGGLIINITDGVQKASVICIDGDTPETVAAKIVAAWNQVKPDSANLVGPTNDIYNVVNPIPYDARNIQLRGAQPFSFSVEDATLQTAITDQPSTETAIPEEKSNWLLWLLLGGGALYLITRKKRKQ